MGNEGDDFSNNEISRCFMIHLARMIATLVVFFVIVPLAFTQVILPSQGAQGSTPASAEDQKVFRTLSPEGLEKILVDFKMDFNKSKPKKGDEHYFEFKSDKYRVRLTQYASN